MGAASQLVLKYKYMLGMVPRCPNIKNTAKIKTITPPKIPEPLDLIPPSPNAFDRCIKTMRNECELWVIENTEVLPKKTVDEINKFIHYTKEDVDKVDHLSIKRSLRSLEEALFESADFFEVAKESLPKPAVLLALIKLLLDVATM